ncbi:MAG: 23S rRNA (uracil(1939)-C(5))-methyltransferase RlmD [Gammaproteobacteria bacterium]
MPDLHIEKLDSRGRGVAMHGDLPVICDGALPGELVRIEQSEQSRRILKAQSYSVVRPVEARITPLCRYFGECGGCQLQQARYDAQVAYKESQLKHCLEKYGDVCPEQWLASLTSAAYHYRRRVRLGVRTLANGEVIIGFHRKNHFYLLDIETCPILEPRLHLLLGPLHQLVASLSVKQRVPQIEMSCGEQEVAVVIRHLLPLSPYDELTLRDFARDNQLILFTQAQGPESICPLQVGQTSTLQYSLQRHQVRLTFSPTDFIQANASINAQMLDAVLLQLDIQENDSVLDLYSGIGNFSLPLARYAHKVTGIEGNPELVARARYNADHNGLSNVRFQHADLNSWEPDFKFNKVILDPPRQGAMNMIKTLSDTADTIVYVSCMPRTLARDARYLVHRSGYRLIRAGLIDMFPQTRHIEAIAVFKRGNSVC